MKRDNGFSLIELVVVVAVLAVLSAIAIPNFQSMTQKARAAAASNTVATIAKECAVKYANGESSPTFPIVTLDGYAHLKAGGSTTSCTKTTTIVATSDDTALYPTWTYDTVSGAKTCDATGMSAADKIKTRSSWDSFIRQSSM